VITNNQFIVILQTQIGFALIVTVTTTEFHSTNNNQKSSRITTTKCNCKISNWNNTKTCTHTDRKTLHSIKLTMNNNNFAKSLCYIPQHVQYLQLRLTATSAADRRTRHQKLATERDRTETRDCQCLQKKKRYSVHSTTTDHYCLPWDQQLMETDWQLVNYVLVPHSALQRAAPSCSV